MKKLLFLLFPVFSYGQITIVKTTTINSLNVETSTTNATNFASGSKTMTVGKLYLWITATTGTVNPGTATGTTLTWSSIVSTGNSTRRIQIFGCIPGSTVTSEEVTFNTVGGSCSGYVRGLWEVSGLDVSGGLASAVVQTTTGGTTGTDPSLTLAALGVRNAVIALFYNDINPFGGTEESGWTEDFDNGYATPDAGTYVTSRLNTTDNTPTVTSASSTWIGVALELKAAGRRVIVIN